MIIYQLCFSNVLCLVNNVGVTVFLVSLKAGGVALNLTEASRVYLMDSWWNPAASFPYLPLSSSADSWYSRLNIVRALTQCTYNTY
jgi:hypothetical protein